MDWPHRLLLLLGVLAATGVLATVAAYVAVVRHAALERLAASVLRRGLRRIDDSSRKGEAAAYVVSSSKEGAHLPLAGLWCAPQSHLRWCACGSQPCSTRCRRPPAA